jgi:hypothetical protein
VLLDTPELQANLRGGLSRFCPKGSWAGVHFGLSYGPVRGRQSGISRRTLDRRIDALRAHFAAAGLDEIP